MKPFLRWTGGKAALVPEIRKLLPPSFGTLHEPFCGSAALFFALEPARAVLSDANTMLTRTFGAVREDTDKVISSLRLYADAYAKHGAPFYLHARNCLSEDMDSPELAAVFIFLNKTNFNGMWRVNADGKYNVPPGKFSVVPVICDEERLLACAKALSAATVINCDFRAVAERARADDLVYFDSPYEPVSKTADFTGYTRGGFGPAEQKALRDLATQLKRKGVYVLLSNSDTPAVRELYAGWELHEITRGGSMNSNVSKRGKVKELLIR